MSKAITRKREEEEREGEGKKEGKKMGETMRWKRVGRSLRRGRGRDGCDGQKKMRRVEKEEEGE